MFLGTLFRWEVERKYLYILTLHVQVNGQNPPILRSFKAVFF
jgi:hypothetical protein